MTHRQRAGLVVIGVALVLVVVIAGQQAHLVAGSGQAAPVPGPPAVGDCVLDPLHSSTLEGANVTATSGGKVPVYPVQQIRPCMGARYGEIAAVIPAPGRTVVKGDTLDGLYLDDPNMDSCFDAARLYVGTTTHLILRFWQTYLQIDFALSRPSARQEAAGQHWAACIVTRQSSATPSERTASQRYSGTMRSALQTGQQRDHLGRCITAGDWDAGIDVDSCARPHVLEILGYGDSGGHPVTRTELEQTCQQLIRQVTAMPDTTASGALSIEIHVQDNDTSTAITTTQIPAHSFLQCAITATGHRKLDSSLIALGRQPIPWA